MNPFKNYDWKHVLAYLVCGAVLGIAQLPALKQCDPFLYMALGPLALYAGIALPQAGAGSSGAVEGAKKLGAVVFLLLGLGLVCVPQTACSPQAQQAIDQVIADIPAGVKCVMTVIADAGGAVDIPGTIALCGVTASDIYSIISGLQLWAEAAKAYAASHQNDGK
ncbi:MAG: hypothetical protein ACYCPT_02100 [Acidimicrobiales bacterium]